MDFNICSNSALNKASTIMAGDAMQHTDAAKTQANPAGSVTITQAAAAPEDIAAAGIPEETLSRDDALGRFVSSAFSLPPPPMPDFK